MNFGHKPVELSESHFQKIRQLVYQVCGIHLKDGKQALVRARLMKRLRALGLSGFDAYLRYIEGNKGGEELGCMIDVITTNKTSFFREPSHFNYLRDHVLPEISDRRKMRFWTAACSSGEEAYSLAIVLEEHLAELRYKDLKILATDISTRMLEKARQAVYEEDLLRECPAPYVRKYFIPAGPGRWQIKEPIRRRVRVARLNLMDPWPMKGSFNVIFCRNVMIYFDRPTQQKLVNRLWRYLEPDGYLFVGHSEGLSAISHQFRYVRPAIYRK